MNLRRKNALLVVLLLAVVCLLPPKAYAAESTEGQSFWDKVKDAGSTAADYVGEHKDGWIESAKNGASAAADKAGELYDAAKEAAPGVIDAAKSGIADAHQQFVDWNDQQRDEVIAWSDSMINGTGDSSATSGDPATGSNGAMTDGDAPAGSDPAQWTTADSTSSESAPAATTEPPTTADAQGAQDQTPNLPGYETSSDSKTTASDSELSDNKADAFLESLTKEERIELIKYVLGAAVLVTLIGCATKIVITAIHLFS